MNIEIDKDSGFCFGVEAAIKKAKEELMNGKKLYCLGQIVHNDMEVKRLEDMGMITLSYDEFKQIKNADVLLRAHGEPPETYKIAKENNINLIDATCPIVTKFQKKVKKAHDESVNDDQIVIYGKKAHPEVIGLSGQIDYKAIIIENENDIKDIDFSKPINLYAQTTKSIKGYQNIKDKIRQNSELFGENRFNIYNTLCGQVSGREPQLREFAAKHDTIIFVSGRKSSNGKMLFDVCKQVNKNTHFISSAEELNPEWIKNPHSIGICGATSTPKWLMVKTKKAINNLIS
ncbi:MAG: 4-hydroxy-3-methylbut-2-enyl diphosphate reductase [Bacteroidota bacterium]